MEALFVIFFLAAGVWYFWGRRHWRISRARDALAGIPDFVPTFYFVGGNCITVAMDGATGKIAFVDCVGNTKVYEHREVVTAEICRNIVSFSKTNRLSQLFSALVWDWFFGPKGFRIGGLTGSTTTDERVNVLSLKVYLKDISYPVKEIVFYRGPAISVGSARYDRCIAAAEEWQARLRLATAEFGAWYPTGTAARTASRLLGKRGPSRRT